MPEFQWDSDANQIPRLLPENYILPTIIHPLAIWQQWHYGVSFKDGIVVGPLKMIGPKDCPKTSQQRFKLMRKFCKALDESSDVSGRESIAELGVIFNENAPKWQELGILLPKTTPMNRSQTCSWPLP